MRSIELVIGKSAKPWQTKQIWYEAAWIPRFKNHIRPRLNCSLGFQFYCQYYTRRWLHAHVLCYLFALYVILRCDKMFSLLVTLFLLFSFAVLASYVYYLLDMRKIKNIPGPHPLPFIGSAHEFTGPTFRKYLKLF